MKNAFMLGLTFCAILVFLACSEEEDLIPTPIADGNATLLLSGYSKIELGESTVTYDNNTRPVRQQLILPIEQFGEGLFVLLGLDEKVEEFVAFALDDEQELNGDALAFLEGAVYSGEGFSLQEMDEDRIQLSGLLSNQENGSEWALEVMMDLRNFGRGTSSFTIQGDTALLNGTLGTITYNQLLDLNASYRNVHTILFQAIPGSENDEVNIQIGRLIREAGYTTIASATSTIHSGGVDLFCAGKKRLVASGAEFGVHSWCCGENGEPASEIPVGAPGHHFMIDYFNEMLGTSTGEDFYFFTINAAPFDELYIMTPEDIATYGLSTE